MQVGDFPGLLRLIAWSLNGLDVRIVRAKLSNKDGARSTHPVHTTRSPWIVPSHLRPRRAPARSDKAQLARRRLRVSHLSESRKRAHTGIANDTFWVTELDGKQVGILRRPSRCLVSPRLGV